MGQGTSYFRKLVAFSFLLKFALKKNIVSLQALKNKLYLIMSISYNDNHFIEVILEVPNQQQK